MTTREELEAKARSIGKTIGSALPQGVGFALLIFNFGERGHLAWISSADRADMLNALREFLQTEGIN